MYGSGSSSTDDGWSTSAAATRPPPSFKTRVQLFVFWLLVGEEYNEMNDFHYIKATTFLMWTESLFNMLGKVLLAILVVALLSWMGYRAYKALQA